MQGDVKYLSALWKEDCIKSHMDIVLLYVNNWSTHSIDAENDLKGNTLGTIRFSQNGFQGEYSPIF